MGIYGSEPNNNNNDYIVQEKKNEKKIEDTNTDKNPLVISPLESENITLVIQSSLLENKESLKSKVGEILESVKENASNIVEKVVKEEQDINSFKRDIESNLKSKEQLREEFVVPVVGEKFSFSKKILSEDINIEKRWEEKEEVKIPIRYEKLFVNDKEIDVYSKQGIISQIKEKISDVVHSDSSSDMDEETEIKKNDDDNKNNNKEIKKQKIEEPQLKGEKIPLFDNQQIENNNKQLSKNNITKSNKYEILIPLYAEEVTVLKKMVKVGEIAISKRKLIENENVNINTIKEQITIEHADGRKEKITDY
jgi:stress response protein YsnF